MSAQQSLDSFTKQGQFSTLQSHKSNGQSLSITKVFFSYPSVVQVDIQKW